MPLLLDDYAPPWWLRGGHRQTVLPSLSRRVADVAYRRERIELPDGDFLDIDWGEPATGEPCRGTAVLAHGLEGNSNRAYMRGMARALASDGWRVCAWNLRGCSGEPNRLLRAYHSGATEDLAAVVRHVLDGGEARLALVGFSLGGNLTLKWLGDLGPAVPPQVHAAVGISVPVDLAGAAQVMDRASRRPYMRRFLRTLCEKAEEKARRFPGAPDPAPLRGMRTFREFDGHFTAPVHGFASAEDYWQRASSLPVLDHIRVPTLLLQALDDPFLSASCYPREIASGSASVHLVTPRWGGARGVRRSRGLLLVRGHRRAVPPHGVAC